MYGVMLDCCSVVRFREVAAAGMAMRQLVTTRNRGCLGFTPCWYVILILSENLARPLRATPLRPSSPHTDIQNKDVISPSQRPSSPSSSSLPEPHHQKTPLSVSASNPTPGFSEPQHPAPFPFPNPRPSPPINPTPSAHSIIHPSPDRPSLGFNAHLAISATKHARRAAAYVGLFSTSAGSEGRGLEPRDPSI